MKKLILMALIAAPFCFGSWIYNPPAVDLSGFSGITALDHLLTFSDDFSSTWDDGTNALGFVVGGGADVATPGEIYFSSESCWLMSPKTTDGFAYAELDADMANTTATVEISTDGTNWVPGVATSQNVFVRVGVLFGPPSMGGSSYMRVYSLSIYGFEKTELVGGVNNFIGSKVRVDTPIHDQDAVPLSVHKLGLTYTDNKIQGYAMDAEKTVRGRELRLGNMWVVSPADDDGTRFVVSGGEISGGGELLGTKTDFVISKNDYPLMSFTSEASGLHTEAFDVSVAGSNDVIELFISTNGVVAQPYAEWTESLTVGEWHRVLSYDEESYPASSEGTYTLKFSVPSKDTLFFRAMQPDGESVATVNADILSLDGSRITDVSEIVFTNGAKIVVSGDTLIFQPN